MTIIAPVDGDLLDPEWAEQITDAVNALQLASGTGLAVGALKSSNQSVNSGSTGTTLVNATDLVVDVEANAMYLGELVLYYNAHATPDIKFGLTVPSGTTGTWGGTGYDFTSTLLAFGPLNITTALGFGGMGATDKPAILKVSLTTGSTAGEVRVQFAQSTSDGNNSTLLAGSSMKFWRCL